MAEEFERISGRYLLNVVEDAPDFRDYEYGGGRGAGL